MDAARDTGGGELVGLAADDFGHLGEAERAEVDAAMAGDPARGGEQARQLGAGRGRVIAECADDGDAVR